MKAPFPWFGGKRRVASEVWAALGDVDHYVEPFAGSLAVLLERPAWHRGTTATVNDADRFIANFWRALIADPEGVAAHADWPVNEADLEARHLWLVTEGRRRIEAMAADPDAHDVKVAGWWVWGICSWIGSGWCSGDGPWTLLDDGTVGKRPHLGNAGRGIADYLSALADHLRGVRVVCGDWTRVVTDGALIYGATAGVFVDPPYLGDVRTSDLYSVDDHTIAHAVRDWCLANGDNPRLRIVLAGYVTEHDHLIPDTWQRHRWSAIGGYSTAASVARADGNHENRHLETLWLSPHCLGSGGQLDLFGGPET